MVAPLHIRIAIRQPKPTTTITMRPATTKVSESNSLFTFLGTILNSVLVISVATAYVSASIRRAADVSMLWAPACALIKYHPSQFSLYYVRAIAYQLVPAALLPIRTLYEKTQDHCSVVQVNSLFKLLAVTRRVTRVRMELQSDQAGLERETLVDAYMTLAPYACLFVMCVLVCRRWTWWVGVPFGVAMSRYLV